MQGLGDVFARYPDQRLYKYSNMTDLPPFEPELDAIPPAKHKNIVHVQPQCKTGMYHARLAKRRRIL